MDETAKNGIYNLHVSYCSLAVIEPAVSQGEHARQLLHGQRSSADAQQHAHYVTHHSLQEGIGYYLHADDVGITIL